MSQEFNLDELNAIFTQQIEKIDGFIERLKEKRDIIAYEFKKRLDELKDTGIDTEKLIEFLKSKEKFVLLPKKANEWYVIVPRFVLMNIGWLDHQTPNYNIFVITRYTNLIYDLPEELRSKLKIPKGPDFRVIDHFLYTGIDLQDVGYEKYKSFLFRREGRDRIRIKKGQEFALIAKLIEDGCLPFPSFPVDEEDLRDYQGIELRSYQQVAWENFLKMGCVGIYWGFGTGKSLLGVYALGKIKGDKIVVVPTVTLKEQWQKRIKEYVPQYEKEISIVTYLAYNKVKNNKYSLVIFDEVHHLPANSYIKFSTLNRKYSIGLSGSPFREDGRENYIFALTGYPIGISWAELLNLNIIAVPRFKLYIVANENAKLKKIDELLRLPLKTIIFCDSIALGKQISQKFGIPFVFGETKKRIETLQQSDVCVVSRVGDEGISIKDLERIIEVAFLFGSRMQESQRFGRLMHSQKYEPEHIIIMTEEEFKTYQKRLYAIYERGFTIEVIR
jgi:DNA excision repair protein ERCC-3